MSAPLYFFPKVMLSGFAQAGKPSRSLLESRGLGHLTDLESLNDLAHCEVCGKGPSGDPGIVFSPLPIVSREPPRRMGYYHADQNWTRINDLLYIGVDPAFPPTPEDLLRKSFFPGYKITLGDGQTWEVPIIRDFSTRSPRLPQDMFLDEYGSFTMQLRDEYAELWKKTERVARLFFDPKSSEFCSIQLDQALAISLDALSLNYRIGQPEQRVLRLVTSENWQDVLGATVDWPFFETYLQKEEEASKKNGVVPPGPDLTSSTPGGSASIEHTLPAAPNSNS
jgi:hypothetical protein